MQQTDNGYKYKIDECDVSDKKSLEKFREKHSEWVNWFGVDDENTIANQIYSISGFFIRNPSNSSSHTQPRKAR